MYRARLWSLLQLASTERCAWLLKFWNKSSKLLKSLIQLLTIKASSRYFAADPKYDVPAQEVRGNGISVPCAGVQLLHLSNHFAEQQLLSR